MRTWLFTAIAWLGASACTCTPRATTSCLRGSAGDGSCCPPWTRGDDRACAPRRWMLSSASDGLGAHATQPAAAVDATGRGLIAWQQFADGHSDIDVAREGHGAWSITSLTGGEPGLRGGVELSAASGQAAMVAWVSATPDQSHHFVEARVADGGGWREPAGGGKFSFEPFGDQQKVLAARDGELIVTWNQGMTVNGGMQRGVCVATRPSPGTAGATEPFAFHRPSGQTDVLSRSAYFTNSPVIARNDRGDAIITWYESIGGKLRTFVSERWGADGRFSHPQEQDALSPAETDVELPEVAVAEDGRGAVLWRQKLPEGRWAVFLAERGASGAWDKPKGLGDSFSEPADFADNPHIAYARSGDLYAIWQARTGKDYAVYLAHRDSRGRWLASGRAPLRLSSAQSWGIDPVLRIGDQGGVVALWRQPIGGRWRVFARRSAVDQAGASEAERWDAPADLSIDDGDASAATLAIGGLDRVLAVWVQHGRVLSASIR